MAGVQKQGPVELASDRLVDDIVNLASQDSEGDNVACGHSSTMHHVASLDVCMMAHCVAVKANEYEACDMNCVTGCVIVLAEHVSWYAIHVMGHHLSWHAGIVMATPPAEDMRQENEMEEIVSLCSQNSQG